MTMGNDLADSAGPALRVFRLQILYTLARLTEPQTALQASVWPEGVEAAREAMGLSWNLSIW